ncbi:MAG: hypothetical protein ACRDYC_12750 [Acidimicrobiales bacterium]
MDRMPMREDCRHFQSRTYSDGEVVRLCTLNLAPEAPWRCPDNCPRYQRDIIDSTFVVGSLARPAVEEEPEDAPEDIVELLEQAEEVLAEAGPGIVAEVERERARESKRWWQRRRKGDQGPPRLSSR